MSGQHSLDLLPGKYNLTFDIETVTISLLTLSEFDHDFLIFNF